MQCAPFNGIPPNNDPRALNDLWGRIMAKAISKEEYRNLAIDSIIN